VSYPFDVVTQNGPLLNDQHAKGPKPRSARGIRFTAPPKAGAAAFLRASSGQVRRVVRMPDLTALSKRSKYGSFDQFEGRYGIVNPIYTNDNQGRACLAGAKCCVFSEPMWAGELNRIGERDCLMPTPAPCEPSCGSNLKYGSADAMLECFRFDIGRPPVPRPSPIKSSNWRDVPVNPNSPDPTHPQPSRFSSTPRPFRRTVPHALVGLK